MKSRNLSLIFSKGETEVEVVNGLDNDLTVIASQTKMGSTSVLLSTFNNAFSIPDVLEISLDFSQGQTKQSVVGQFYRIYDMDDSIMNPRQEWIDVGQPWNFVKSWQIDKVRKKSQLRQSNIKQLNQSKLSLKLKVPSVTLLQICPIDILDLQQPFDVHFHQEKMTNVLIIMWKYPSKAHCIDTFLIEFSPTMNFDHFHKIAETKSVNNFHFLPNFNSGWYRIRAKSFNGSTGPYSIPVLYFSREI